MSLITGETVELSALDPKLARLVTDRVASARGWSDRFATIEALIAERVANATIPGGVTWAWRKLEAADGGIPLGRVVPEIDCSHRALIAQFQRCIGVNPKAFGRLLRFDRAMRSLNGIIRSRSSAPASKPYIECQSREGRCVVAVPWAHIAADSGYFDQSHFIREFRRFTGVTPTAFVRQMSAVA
jgi:AraC-like DNA-binding protein